MLILIDRNVGRHDTQKENTKKTYFLLLFSAAKINLIFSSKVDLGKKYLNVGQTENRRRIHCHNINFVYGDFQQNYHTWPFEDNYQQKCPPCLSF